MRNKHSKYVQGIGPLTTEEATWLDNLLERCWNVPGDILGAMLKHFTERFGWKEIPTGCTLNSEALAEAVAARKAAFIQRHEVTR